MNIKDTIIAIDEGNFDSVFSRLYPNDSNEKVRARYKKAVNEYFSLYGDADISLFSVPGRSEIAGNHTDHNHGKVIAASVDLDIIAVAAKRDDDKISVTSEGFSPDNVNISSLIPDQKLFGSSAALISGVCDGFLKNGYKIGGYNAYTTSNVLKGSGLSSSAAFEVMIGNILNHFYNSSEISNIRIAMIAQYAENVFFGKPCGLMDQMACAVGGFITIDFADPKKPDIKKLPFDLTAHKYSLCIVNTGGNHTDLTDDYAAVPTEMKQVASSFGKEVLSGIKADEIINKACEIRENFGDRALLRALHFADENVRVETMTNCLENDNISGFFDGVIESGESSQRLLQNIFTVKAPNEQGLTLALELCRRFLKDKKGAWRVHGGGFAGTVQAYLPECVVEEFKEYIGRVFGKSNVYILSVRPLGAIKL